MVRRGMRWGVRYMVRRGALSRVAFKVPTAIELAERKPLIAQAAAAISQVVDSRVQAAAEALDRTNIVQARLQRVNEAILQLLPLLYKADSHGNHWNVDPVTRRIKVSTPWGSSGWRRGDNPAKRWGLVQPEQRRLGWVLRKRMETQPGSAMFLYLRNGWCVATGYETYEQALYYWREWKPIKHGEWILAKKP